MKTRCLWTANNQLLIDYHDYEWGQSDLDNQSLFESLSLEIFQSGLSWLTVLKKRQNFRKAYLNFDPLEIIQLNDQVILKNLVDLNLINHPKKGLSIKHNAFIFNNLANSIKVSDYIWNYKKYCHEDEQVSHLTEDLKNLGFQMIGPVTIQSFLETVGFFNHHQPQCFMSISKF